MFTQNEGMLFDDLLLSYVAGRMQVSSDGLELAEVDADRLRDALVDFAHLYLATICSEWEIDPEWFEFLHVDGQFLQGLVRHDSMSHEHDGTNRFGWSKRVIGDKTFFDGAHAHVGEYIIGSYHLGDLMLHLESLIGKPFLGAMSDAQSKLITQKMREEIERMNGLNDVSKELMGMHKHNDSAFTASGEIAVAEEKVSTGYDASRVKKYDQSFSDASIGEIAAAFGESFDEVMNRRDISADDKFQRDFFGVSATGLSTIDKTFPAFHIPLALMAIEAILAQDFSVLKSVNFKWGRPEPVASGLFEVGFGQNARLITNCYRACETKDGAEKMMVQTRVESTTSGPVLCLRLVTLNDKADLANKFADSMRVWMKDHNYYRGKKISADGKFLNVSKYNWDDIVLDADVKDGIFDDIVGFLNHERLYRVNNLPFKRGLILHGKPGCGKTLLGKVVANEVRASFLWVTAAQAGTPEFIKEIFELAREISPTVLFFEDIDMYTVDRGYGVFNAKVGELLSQMDGMEDNNGLIVVATTNRLDVIEKALAERPSRFDRRYSLDKMSQETCEKMVSKKIGNAQLTNVTIPEIAQMVMGLNGSFIQEVIISAKRKAISRGIVNSEGVAVLGRELLQESTSEVMKAFNIAMERLERGDYTVDNGWEKSLDRPEATERASWSMDGEGSVFRLTQNFVPATEEADVVTLATNVMPRNVNLTQPEKDEMDAEIRTALTVVAKASEHDTHPLLELYVNNEKLDDQVVALTGKTITDITWSDLDKSDLRKIFRLLMLCRNVRRVMGAEADFDNKVVLGKILHAMDMLSDRYYWVHALSRIEQEFGRRIALPFNVYKDQTSSEAAMKLYREIIGELPSAREREDAVNRANGLPVTEVEETGRPGYQFNSPKNPENVSKPIHMK